MDTLWVGKPTVATRTRDLVVGDVLNYGGRMWKVTGCGEDADGRFLRVTVYRGSHKGLLRPGTNGTFAKAGHVKTKEVV